MNPGQKMSVKYRPNRMAPQIARRRRDVLNLGYRWNAIEAAINDIETVRVIREYLKGRTEMAAA